MKSTPLLIIAATAIALALTGKFIEFNVSASEPKGIYLKTAPLELYNSDMVTFNTNTNQITKLANDRHYTTRSRLMKTIMGVPGDHISIIGRNVYINNEPIGTIQAEDSKKRPLPSILHGGAIPPNYYFLASTLHKNSFDSRYFGLIPRECIINKVTPILTL